MNLKPSTIATAVAIALVSIGYNLKQVNATTQDPTNTANQQLNVRNSPWRDTPGGSTPTTPTNSEIVELGLRTQAAGIQPTQLPATVGAQVTPQEAINNQINNFLNNAGNLVNDVTGFVQNDLLGTLNGFIGAIGIPDLGQLASEIMGSSTSNNAGTELSETLENKIGGEGRLGSYAIRDDYNMQAQRTAAISTANNTSLSREAQARSAQILTATRADTETNIQLGNSSQNMDVTQRILQNLSQQTALNGVVQARLLGETQSTKNNSAISNVILSQAAKEISAQNTTDRRGRITSGNLANQQAGLAIMPGGLSLAGGNTDNNDTWFTRR